MVFQDSELDLNPLWIKNGIKKYFEENEKYQSNVGWKRRIV